MGLCFCCDEDEDEKKERAASASSKRQLGDDEAPSSNNSKMCGIATLPSRRKQQQRKSSSYSSSSLPSSSPSITSQQTDQSFFPSPPAVTSFELSSSSPPTLQSMDRVMSDISEDFDANGHGNDELELASDVRAVAWLRSRSLESLEEQQQQRLQQVQQNQQQQPNNDNNDESFLFDTSFEDEAAVAVLQATGGIGDDDVMDGIVWQQAVMDSATVELHPLDPLRTLRQKDQQSPRKPFALPPPRDYKNKKTSNHLNTTAVTVDESIEVDELSEIIRQQKQHHQQQQRQQQERDTVTGAISNSTSDDGSLPVDSLVEFSVANFSPPRDRCRDRFALHYQPPSSPRDDNDEKKDSDNDAAARAEEKNQAAVTSLFRNPQSPLVIRRLARQDDVDDDDVLDGDDDNDDDEQQPDDDDDDDNDTDALMMEFDQIIALALPSPPIEATTRHDDDDDDEDANHITNGVLNADKKINPPTTSRTPLAPPQRSSFSLRRKLNSNQQAPSQQLQQEDDCNDHNINDHDCDHDHDMTKPNCLASSPLWRVATKSRGSSLRTQQQQRQQPMQQQQQQHVKPGMILVAADEDQRELPNLSPSRNAGNGYTHRGGRPSPPPPPLLQQPSLIPPPPPPPPPRTTPPGQQQQRAADAAPLPQMQDVEIMASSSDTPAPTFPSPPRRRPPRQPQPRVPPTRLEEKAAIQAAAFQLSVPLQQQQQQQLQRQSQQHQDLSSTSTTAADDSNSNTNHSDESGGGTSSSSNLQASSRATRHDPQEDDDEQDEDEQEASSSSPRRNEDALSNVPSHVDEQSKERYLAACRFLKSTLTTRKEEQPPQQPNMMMVHEFLAQQKEQEQRRHHHQQQEYDQARDEYNQNPYTSRHVVVEPAAALSRPSSRNSNRKSRRNNNSPTILLEQADSDIFNVDSVTSSAFDGQSNKQHQAQALTLAAIKTSLRQKQKTLAAFPDLRQQQQQQHQQQQQQSHYGSSVANMSTTARSSIPGSEMTLQIHNRTTLADVLYDEEGDDETTTATGSYVAHHHHHLPAVSPAPSMAGSTASDGVASTATSVRDYPFMILGNQNRTLPGVLTPRLMEALRGFFPMPIANANFWLKFAVSNNNNNSSSSTASSLPMMLDRIYNSRYTVIGVETKEGHVFGSFCSSPWRVQSSWFGSNDSLLWRLKRSRKQVGDDQHHHGNNDSFCSNHSSGSGSRTGGGDHHHRISPNYEFDNEMEIYPCSAAEQIQYCTEKTIAVGGGDWDKGNMPRPKSPKMNRDPSGIGFMIDGDLMGGETNPCATFNNPRLSMGTGNNNSNKNEFDIVHLEVWTLTHCTTIEDAEAMEQGQVRDDMIMAQQQHLRGRRLGGGGGREQLFSASPTSLLGDMDFSEV